MAAPLSPLVGRDHELDALRERLAAALVGQGGLVLISGEAGIGKTALAEALCQEAVGQGALVRIGRCYDLTETPPYGPFLELFRHYEPLHGLPPLPAAFSRWGAVGGTVSQSALFDQVREFLAAMAAVRPVVILFDDLHWADHASLDLLRVLARSVHSLPVLVLITYRADELTRQHPLRTLLPLLDREAAATRLVLRPLAADAVRALITARYTLAESEAARLVAYLGARAEGNALFVTQLLRALEEEEILFVAEQGWELGDLSRLGVPLPLMQVIDARLTRLADETQALLAVAAVLGQEVPLGLWAAVAAVTDEVILSAVEQASAARLVDALPDGMTMRFVHALVREALYEGMLPPRRRIWHRKAGEVLATVPAVDPDSVAYHFQRSGDGRALPWLQRAGARAQAAFAWTTAAARFEAAVGLMEGSDENRGEHAWLLLRLAGVLRYTDVPKAWALMDRCVALAVETGDAALSAYARYQGGLLTCMGNNLASGLPDLEAGADALAALSEADRAHFAAHTDSVTLVSHAPDGRGQVVRYRAVAGRLHAARNLGEQLVAAAGSGDTMAGESLRDGGYFGLGDSYAALGLPDQATAMYACARDIYARAGQHVLSCYTLCRELELVALPYRTEDIPGRRRLAERYAAAWVRASSAVPTTNLPDLGWLPLLALEGRWEELERLALVASTMRQGTRSHRTMALRYLAPLARLRGDTERAWSAVHEQLPAGPATEPGTVPFADYATALQREAALLALDAGDLPTAKDWLEAHDRWLAWSGAILGAPEGQGLWAQYHHAVGDAAGAYSYARSALALASEPRRPLALLAAHRLLAELDIDAGRFDNVPTHLDAAIALADACAAPYERALTLLAAAECWIATGRHDEARSVVDEAHAICAWLGAKPTLARADALAATLHNPSSSLPVSTYPAGLSGREIDVLRLVATGRTNREIAVTLFLSERTVQVHVRNILAKTNTDNRTAAAAFARDRHLV